MAAPMIELSDEKITELKQRLLGAVPPQVSRGNEALRSELGWTEDQYWYIRNQLLQSGDLQKGRGRGGSVRRVVQIAPIGAVSQVASPTRIAESDLYSPIMATLQSHWVPDHQVQDWVAELTAQQGRRDTGGKWTRPDITLASCNTYKFVPGIQVELNTFEVKTHDGLDVTAVYEALAHRRAAHYAYVLAYIPDNERPQFESVIERLGDDASEHGIGLVVIADPADYDTWNFEVEPSRNDPDPADLDSFIRTQCSEEFKDRIIEWCRQR
jgi:hypothetical protein